MLNISPVLSWEKMLSQTQSLKMQVLASDFLPRDLCYYLCITRCSAWFLVSMWWHGLLFWWRHFAVKDANMLVFVTPHQFMHGICEKLVGKIKGDVEAISLIKGMEVKMEGPCMISTFISQQLEIKCCVLMGANLASEVITTSCIFLSWRFKCQVNCHSLFLKPEATMQIAVEKFSEATVGYRENREIAEKWVQLFSTPYFLVTAVCTIDPLFSR